VIGAPQSADRFTSWEICRRSGEGAIRISLKRREDIARLAVTGDRIGLDALAGMKRTGSGTRYIGVVVRQLHDTLPQSPSPAGSSFDIRISAFALGA
jgi:two-component sensor histidine kinase